jgi:hypothetical protein
MEVLGRLEAEGLRFGDGVDSVPRRPPPPRIDDGSVEPQVEVR